MVWVSDLVVFGPCDLVVGVGSLTSDFMLKLEVDVVVTRFGPNISTCSKPFNTE